MCAWVFLIQDQVYVNHDFGLFQNVCLVFVTHFKIQIMV